MGEADGQCSAARTEEGLPPVDSVRLSIRGFQRDAMGAFTAAGAGGLTTEAVRSIPGLCRARKAFARLSPALPCWDAGCTAKVAKGWLACPECLTVHPDVVTCGKEGCAAVFKGARCRCGESRAEGTLASTNDGTLAAALLNALGALTGRQRRRLTGRQPRHRHRRTQPLPPRPCGRTVLPTTAEQGRLHRAPRCSRSRPSSWTAR